MKNEQKLRVLHVNKFYAPWIGGVEAAVQVLVEEMAASSRVSVHVLASQPRGWSTEEVVNGVSVTRVGSLGVLMSMPLAPSFPLVLRSMRRRFDIVHVHVPFPLAVLAGWTRRTGEPHLVVHYHCDLSRATQRAVMRLLEPLNRRMFNSADRIIVTSDRMLRSSTLLAHYERKCKVIPLPAATACARVPTAAERSAARRRFDLLPGRRVVLFVGRLVYYKGLEHLLAAMKHVHAQLLIVGEGPLRRSLEKRVEVLALRERVRFLGKLAADELQLAYQVSDVFVLPSTASAEAFGMVQIEAMQHGCPVVNTDLPTGVPSVGVHQRTGLTVPPADHVALAWALNLILGDDELRARMSEHARWRAMEFDRKLIADKVIDVYEEAIAATGATPSDMFERAMG